jgi:hypothetical protein
LQSNGGGEFLSNQIKALLESNGIAHSISCPYTAQQNCLVERKHRHVVEMGLAMLAQSGLSKEFWVESFLTAIFLINRLPTPLVQNGSPFSILFKQPPDYANLRIFRCACYPLLRLYNSYKLMFRRKRCIFLGHGSHYKGYRCFDPFTSKIFITRHVVFDEMSFPTKVGVTASSPITVSATGIPLFFVEIFPSSHVSPTVIPALCTIPLVLAGLVDDNTIDPLLSPTALASPTAPDTPAHPSHASFTALPVECLPNMHNTLPAQSSLASPTLIPTSSLNSHPMVTGAKTRSLKPRSFLDYTALYSTKHPLIALTSILPFVEPSCYTKVVLRPEWRAAMGLEFDALLANGTWSLCPRPLHQHIVRNKWVYKIKHQQDGSIEHFKARLVAKGFD